ncbi:AlpA family transcriptional regulator [uncultured Oxalobacter sp.]|uniref:helix-turn-helix transcriptional regulator n=1 Tax=uncultured Oxalobacter sp. TaxID=337245 RepID=UPI00338DC594
MVKKLLKIRDVMERTACSRTAIYEKMKHGAFPKQIKLGERAVAWMESDIDAWIEQQQRASV